MLKENKKAVSPDFYCSPAYIYTCVLRTPHGIYVYHQYLILIAFITGNSSLEPLIEGLCAQIHVNLR